MVSEQLIAYQYANTSYTSINNNKPVKSDSSSGTITVYYYK